MNIDQITAQLGKLGTLIEDSKKSISQHEGQLIEVKKRAKELGFESEEEGEKIIAKLAKEKEARDKEIEKDFTELKENYEW